MPEPNHQYLARLVTRFKQQDTDAFAELYALTYNKVYNYARHYLKDEYLAQDAMQEVYIAAFRNIDKLSDPTLFIAWLNRISFHVCYDIRQKQFGHSEISDPELLKLVRDEHPDSDPEALALRSSEIRQLRQAMEELPFQERSVLSMRYYNDMKLEEIASTMELSRSTIKRYITSAKEHLARKLKG
ncbi:MAG: RNA polymerase sigma factor [Acetatifactor sp.]|nr:RNA polymerase sigma factor [Acetatifactor sp.]MDE5951211.1 RNA polymerase sigma factor [Acetatifactor sp.]